MDVVSNDPTRVKTDVWNTSRCPVTLRETMLSRIATFTLGVSAIAEMDTDDETLVRRRCAAVSVGSRADVPPVSTTADAEAADESASKRAARSLSATARLSVPPRYTKRCATRRETRRSVLVRNTVPLVSRTVPEKDVM